MSAITTDTNHQGHRNYNRRRGPSNRTVFARAFTLGVVLVAAIVGITALATSGARADIEAHHHHVVVTHNHATAPAHAGAATGAQNAPVKYEQGPWVAKLQRDLGSLNYYESPVDGVYGPQTSAAVKDFQRANGLTVDGIAGAQTMAKIDQQLKTGDSQMTAGTPAPTAPAPTASAAQANTAVAPSASAPSSSTGGVGLAPAGATA